MRASPAFQVTLHRFGVWRGAVVLLAMTGWSVIAAWVYTREEPAGIVVWASAACAAAVSLGWAVSLAQTPAVRLRWDGQLWHLGPPAATADDTVPGELQVAIDLGAWMLLCFTPAAAQHPWRRTWLPAQRRGLEAQWHALRCTVYSPRPAPDADAAGGP